MTHEFRAHPSTFRQREFWLNNELPGTRQKMAFLLCIILFLSIALLLTLFFSKDNTEYATLDKVKKIEAHLYQLEERLVWTDEKIDTIQAATESRYIQPVEDGSVIEHDPLEPDIPKESAPEIPETFPDIAKQPHIDKQPDMTEQPDMNNNQEIKVQSDTARVTPEPKPLPVIHPKIKKNKINRREYGIIYKYHKVRQGETLYRIGLKYNVPVSEIRRLNHLSPNDSIHPGQRLLVSQGVR